jgi:hypothetical protein
MLALSDEMKARAALAKERVVHLMSRLFVASDGNRDSTEYFRLHDLQSQASMACLRGLRTSFPDRSPIYDNDLLSFALTIPSQWKKDGRIVRAALQCANPKLARIPDANSGLPAGLCPPWSTVLGSVQQTVRRSARALASHCRFVNRFREAPPGQRILVQHGISHDMNGVVRLCERYRSMVEAAVERLDATLFDKEVVRRLLRDDLAAKAPRFNMLWEIILTFQLFDERWGPGASRPRGHGLPEQVVRCDS